MATGATKLKRLISRLQDRKLTQELIISRVDRDLIRIEKRIQGVDFRTEFMFLVRTTKTGSLESWWPIEYRSLTEHITCESVANGRTMVNLVKQNDLIELAETWARTLEAQQVTQDVSNALL